MIYDQISNIARYRGLFRGLDVLIDWLGDNDYKALPVGRTTIDGDNVFANVQDASTHEFADARFEVHHRYMDVQVDVDGREAFSVAQSPLTNPTPFDAEKDFGLGDAARHVEGDLDDDRFVVYLAGEPHMPNLAFPGDGVRQIKKICFKVIADEFYQA